MCPLTCTRSVFNQALEEGTDGDFRPLGERFRYDCLMKLVPIEMKDRLEHEFFWGTGQRSYERALRFVRLKTSDYHGMQIGARYLATGSKKVSVDDPMIIGAFTDESAAAANGVGPKLCRQEVEKGQIP